jgi:alkylation response protein AidB-like acyl-CoA dehydrogenase
MQVWGMWKKGFDAWEEATAQYLESVLQSPLVLQPAGAALTAAMKWKARQDQFVAETWARAGIPTRRDQERTLYQLQQIQARLMDLQADLDDARAEIAHLRATDSAPAPADAAAPHADAAPAKKTPRKKGG